MTAAGFLDTVTRRFAADEMLVRAGRTTGVNVAAVGTLATLSLGKLALRGVATMLSRELRDENIHVASLTILGQIAAGTPLDPDRIADAYWTIRDEGPDAWREEYRFDGALV